MSNVIEPTKIQLGKSIDDRGSLSYLNDFSFANKCKRFYVVNNHQIGFVRAWHGHQIEEKYIYVVSGCAVIGAVNLANEMVYKYTFSSEQPTILHIPAGFANGFKTLSPNTTIQFFSTLSLEDSMKDDQRIEWNRWNIWTDDYR